MDPQAKRVLRVVYGVVGLGLIGLFVWLLIIPLLRAQTHFVALPVVDYEALRAAPMAFTREDVDGFKVLKGLIGHGGSQEPIVLAELETSQGMRSLLGEQLKKIAPRRKDVLIVYLSAQGVSEGGVAWLLCSDFDPTRPDSGRIKLAEVLERLSASPAAAKVLLLDGARLVADPRLGMFVNEFPRLLDAEVRAVEDPSLWVITSHGLGELSELSYGMKRSRFGLVTAEALNGAAESDGDGDLTLAELYDYVSRELAEWARLASAGQHTQTPVALLGGRGRVTSIDANVVLLPARHRPASSTAWKLLEPGTAQAAQAEAPPPTSTTSAGTQPTAAAAPSTATASPTTTSPAAASPTATPSDTKPPEPKPADPTAPATATKSGAAETNPPETNPAPPAAKSADRPPPLTDVAVLLGQAWQLREQVQDRSRGDAWSPIDYAPHLWREFQELILAY
ncbi:MAG TPA: hypothetical protein VG713_03690, partial [Pirellulales bacterium]|nr:hypothetical protein [Pirellulales bacterium]